MRQFRTLLHKSNGYLHPIGNKPFALGLGGGYGRPPCAHKSEIARLALCVLGFDFDSLCWEFCLCLPNVFTSSFFCSRFLKTRDVNVSMWAARTFGVARQSRWVPLARRIFSDTLEPIAGEKTVRTKIQHFEDADERVPSESVAAFLLRKRTKSVTQGSCMSRGESECKRVGDGRINRVRWDEPQKVGPYTVGSQTRASIIASNLEKRESARAANEALKYAHRTRLTKESRLRLWTRLCRNACHEPFPVTAEEVALVASILRAAGYRSVFQCG